MQTQILTINTAHGDIIKVELTGTQPFYTTQAHESREDLRELAEYVIKDNVINLSDYMRDREWIDLKNDTKIKIYINAKEFDLNSFPNHFLIYKDIVKVEFNKLTK